MPTRFSDNRFKNNTRNTENSNDKRLSLFYIILARKNNGRLNKKCLTLHIEVNVFLIPLTFKFNSSIIHKYYLRNLTGNFNGCEL